MNRLLRLMPALALMLLLATPAVAAPPAAAPVEGSDYVVIEGGAPYATPPGQVEVAEAFGYTCGHCARFEPALQAWKRGLPRGVRFVAVPAAFGGHWMPYARAYLAAKALGVAERSHGAMFRALHEEGRLPMSRPSVDEIAGFYADYGIPAARFAAAYDAPSMDAELKRARDFLVRSGVDGTPAIVVAGRYRVTGSSAQDTLRIARWLVDRELAATRR